MKPLVTLFLIAASSIYAQPVKYGIEADPIAYGLKGYSVHGLVYFNNWSFDAGLFGAQPPETYHGNDGFDVMLTGFGIKVQYSFDQFPGLYTGIGAGMIKSEATHRKSNKQETGNSLGIGPMIGYRYFPFSVQAGKISGLYLAPWVSVDYNFHYDKVEFGNIKFTQKIWTVFPTIHIGFQF
ncbi:MAG: hypothetical protein LCH54_05480 [Bacteroidetes bacterium]|nr:hypothetical protein [Bacteroidota bacterium]